MAAARTADGPLLSTVALMRRLALQSELADAIELLAEELGHRLAADRVKVELDGREAVIPSDGQADGESTGPHLEVPLRIGEEVLGSVVLGRSATAHPFSAEDEETLQRLAEGAEPFLAALHHQSVAASQHRNEPDHPLFRREALEHRAKTAEADSDPLRVFPRWLGRSYALLLVGLALFVVAAAAIPVEEVARGPAVIVDEGSVSVIASEGGAVSAVEVEAGQQVVPGQVLVRLESQRETLDVRRIATAFKRLLQRRLADPEDGAVAGELNDVRSRLEEARERLAARSIASPVAGRVSDVRVRADQVVVAGQFLLAVSRGERPSKVVALVPGRYRPLLGAGMSLDLRLDGFPGVRIPLRVARIGDQVVGPAELRRALGLSNEDLPMSGASVIVEARLDRDRFEARDSTLRFYDGLRGSVEVPVRRESLLGSLFSQVLDALR